jgi:hypothetical protein
MRSERFAVDSPLTTSSGTTFTSPSAWTPRSVATSVSLMDSHLAFVDVNAGDAAAAVAAAWASYRPDAHRPLKIATACAPCDGWEEGRVYVYETSPNEKVVVWAQAWRASEAWTVAIIEEPALTNSLVLEMLGSRPSSAKFAIRVRLAVNTASSVKRSALAPPATLRISSSSCGSRMAKTCNTTPKARAAVSASSRYRVLA